jgi:rRNA maturation RNase YbeY
MNRGRVMGKLKIECLDRKLKLRKLAKAVYKTLGQISYFKVELVFQDGESMHNLNKTTRGVDSVTDVLSYPSMEGIKEKILRPEECKTELEGKYIFMGSIVLCDDKIRAQAEEYGHSEEREREYLIIHGLLHLFGYDHMTDFDKKEMRDLEKKIVSLLHPDEIEEKQAETTEQADGEEQ